ncbi:UNVERIFIED_CONTAM: putative mitochondrial protein [Sesamum latifolium]|uniref:Mitochondrial protein n=1 Tax=Sesamum latifolium TaxID=2727402 RepID=A0AAW2WQD9_9LAMI
MIKSVLQSIPTYALSVFRLLDSLLNEIQSMIALFFWDNKDKRKIHWISWHQLCKSRKDGGLGFRQLRAFNSALLAKQFWRLLTNPSSLITQVLNARYFPDSSPLYARLGSRPSLTWRSILSTKEIIQANLRFRIGSATSVKIWKDPWIPRPSLFKPISPPPHELEEAKVAALNDPRTDDWDHSIINSLFSPEDRELILKLPVGRVHQPDVIGWHYTAKGMFTVRSAYFVALKVYHPATSSNPCNLYSSGTWKFIWKANVPPKVHLFAWKLVNKALPSGAVLEKRMKISQPPCSYCDTYPECLLHVFLQCHIARQTWVMSDLPWAIISHWKDDPLRWLYHVGQSLQSEEFDFFLVICWFLWWSRNQHCMKNKFVNPLQTITSARCFLEAYRETILRSPTGVPAPTNVTWRSPPNGVIKLNFDGALFQNGAEVGVGVVARDCQGDVWAWLSHRFPRRVEPELAS